MFLPDPGEVRENYLQPLPDCRDHGEAKIITARDMKPYKIGHRLVTSWIHQMHSSQARAAVYAITMGMRGRYLYRAVSKI